MRSLHLTSLFAVGFIGYGCSVINAPDDVVPQGSTSGASTGATGATESIGGKTGGGGAPDTGGTTNTGLGGDEPGVGGDTGVGGASIEDPGPGPNPTTALLVLGASDDKDAHYLSVVNGRTGAGLASEKLPVAAIAYDEAPERHVWFVFTASTFPASPTGAADLEVRRFDDASGKWFVLSRTTALPPPEPDQLVALNERLVYLSHVVENGKAVSALTILDTSSLDDVKELDSRTAAAGETYVGLTGDRGSDVNAEAIGGRLRLMISSGCAADCALDAQQIFVGDSVTDGASVALDRFVGVPRFAKARLEDKVYVAIRSTQPSSRLMVRSFSGPNLTNPTGNQITGFMGEDVGGLTLMECAEAGVITDVAGNALFAFHLVSGQFKQLDLTVPGGPVYGDAFVPSVLALDPTTAPGLRSFDVSKAGVSNVALNERSAWLPDSTLLPYTGATRRGESFKCP